MKKTFIHILIAVILPSCQLFAQVGGLSTYQFLTFQPNARIAALGGTAIATYENDLNLAVQNPALLRPTMNNQFTFNHVFYFADVQAGYIGYAHCFDSTQTFGAALQYVNYGNFQKTGANGESLGTFHAGEYSFNLTYSKRLDPRLYIGAQAKFLYSAFEEYTSVGLAMDAGITYHNPEKLFTVSAVISNLGKQLKSYNQSNSEELPLNFQLGASKKLKNAPFRFTVVANHLEKPGKLVYQNLNKPSLQKDLETGEVVPENITIGTKMLSHLTTSAELLLGKNLYLAFGYNYLRRWEMGLKNSSGFTGFSWGFGIKVSKFQIAYGRSTYMANTSSNHLSLIVYMQDFLKK